jgi:DNA transposition AAA+ family ATPase
MLTNANVRAEIDRRVEEYSRTAGLTVVDVLQQLKAIAFSDLRRLFDEHGRLRPRRSGPRTPLRQWPLGR